MNLPRPARQDGVHYYTLSWFDPVYLFSHFGHYAQVFVSRNKWEGEEWSKGRRVVMKYQGLIHVGNAGHDRPDSHPLGSYQGRFGKFSRLQG